MMARFADEIRQMDVEVDRRRREQDAQEAENRRLKDDLNEMHHLQAKFEQTRITLDEEAARRVAAETEADRLRLQLSQTSSQSATDIENLKRALDDLRFQNEDNINTINLRNEENADLSQQLLETQHQLGERCAELEEMAIQMQELEQKNRQLNDKINEIIYNKAAVYKEKTLDVLRKNPEQGSPRGRRERQQ